MDGSRAFTIRHPYIKKYDKKGENKEQPISPFSESGG